MVEFHTMEQKVLNIHAVQFHAIVAHTYIISMILSTVSDYHNQKGSSKLKLVMVPISTLISTDFYHTSINTVFIHIHVLVCIHVFVSHWTIQLIDFDIYNHDNTDLAKKKSMNSKNYLDDMTFHIL